MFEQSFFFSWKWSKNPIFYSFVQYRSQPKVQGKIISSQSYKGHIRPFPSKNDVIKSVEGSKCHCVNFLETKSEREDIRGPWVYGDTLVHVSGSGHRGRLPGLNRCSHFWLDSRGQDQDGPCSSALCQQCSHSLHSLLAARWESWDLSV